MYHQKVGFVIELFVKKLPNSTFSVVRLVEPLRSLGDLSVIAKEDQVTSGSRIGSGLSRVLIHLKTGELCDHLWVVRDSLLGDAGSCPFDWLALIQHSGKMTNAKLAFAAKYRSILCYAGEDIQHLERARPGHAG
jgi:hypothetical protein